MVNNKWEAGDGSLLLYCLLFRSRYLVLPMDKCLPIVPGILFEKYMYFNLRLQIFHRLTAYLPEKAYLIPLVPV